jgi:hypothetical protein
VWVDDACGRRLRDQLAGDDRYALALSVATRGRVEAAPVWAAWGLALVRMRQLTDARDKLKNFFGAHTNPRRCTHTHVDRETQRQA